jgi:glycosyltransferase involved in cell wall biosynthesis
MSPLKTFEYMASGKAILCSDLPALREVLAHEQTALLCKPDDPQCWKAALERLRDEPGLRQRLGERAKSEFEAKYTWKARAENVLRGI